jgi:hypothetical protein
MWVQWYHIQYNYKFIMNFHFWSEREGLAEYPSKLLLVLLEI